MPRPASGPGSRRNTGTRQRNAKKEKEAPSALEADTTNVSVEIQDLANLVKSTNILIHGPVGNGKTILASGVDNATFLATDQGVVSAKQVGSPAGVIWAPDWEHELAGIRLADQKLGPEDWLILDTWTNAQQLYVQWLLRAINADNPARDMDIPALQDHQKWQNAIKRWTGHVVNAQYNTIFICNSMTKVSDDGDDVVMPLILGGRNNEVCEYVCALMDLILYVEVLPSSDLSEPVVRRVVAQPTTTSDGRRIIAKDHFGVLGRWQDVEEDDTKAMQEFADMIRG
jgi:hypothetical protein